MKKLLLCFLLGLFCNVHSQSLEVTPIDRNIINSLFDGQWEKADSLVDTQVQINPDHPKYYFMKAYTVFYSRYFSTDAPSRDRSIDLVKHYTWQAISAGKILPESMENNFYLGCSYGFLARANAMRGEYWTAYWNGREAESLFESVLEENPDIADAYMCLAVNEYYPAATISGFTSILAWLGGMSGDREKGLEYFEVVLKKGILFKDEAAYALGLAHQFGENDVTGSLPYWKPLNEKFPGNVIFSNFYSRAKLSSLILEKGTDYLEKNFSELREEYSINNAAVLNILGYNLMTQGEMDEALKMFQFNLRLYPEVANCYDSLAECFMNRGDNTNAIKYYKLAYEKLPADTTATEEFKERLKEGINQKLEELGSGSDV